MHRYTGSQTLLIVYGYQVTAEDDPYLKQVEETVDLLSNHLVSLGSSLWLVDIFPACTFSAYYLVSIGDA